METTKQKLLAKGIITDTIHRYIVPIDARDTDRQLDKGDSIKIYGLYKHEVMTETMGQEMIIIQFKRNTSRIMKMWCIPLEQFKNNTSLVLKK
jgi:hypothetical protein